MAAGRVKKMIPPPIGGLNLRDSLVEMPIQDALRLTNFFPGTGSVTKRKGYSQWATGVGAAAVETLATVTTTTGTEKMVGFSGSAMYDISSSGAASAISGATVTYGRWQWINFKNTLVAVNGADAPINWTGTGSATNPTITGTGLTASDLVAVNAYKGRLYFVERNSANVWYLPADSLSASGTAKKFDFSSLLTKGGYILFAGSHTKQQTFNDSEQFVAVSNKGEILLYTGSSPDDTTNWMSVGHFYAPPPLGRRAFFYRGADMHIITEQGVIPLATILSAGFDGNRYKAISSKIDPAILQASQSLSSAFGWEGIDYPLGGYVCINVPIAPGLTSDQYVMNAITGAWCKFTNQPAMTWCLYKDRLYFGGLGGVVYRADDGHTDNGAAITIDWKSAFTVLDDPDYQKQLQMVRPILKTQNALTLAIGADMDFDDTPPASTLAVVGSDSSQFTWADENNSTVGSVWADTGNAATGPYWASAETVFKQWQNISGLGWAVAIKCSATISNSAFELFSLDIMYTQAQGVF